MTERTARLRAAIDGGLARIMAAHAPLPAILAEEAGFDGVWASGFELSALLGLPDVSLVTMTQHLEMVRAIADRTTLPIVADIDTGFGNAVNVVHAVRAYEAAGASAVVIEDKTFPKVSSLAEGGRQDLVRAEEFQGKIAAAVATRRDPGFLVVARTEALIAGLGQEEAMRRARAYEAAGADLVLVHSKSRTPDEVEAFARAWDGRCGLVLVPTAYPALDEARIRTLGTVRMVIYGNHAIRAAVTAMKATFARIRAEGGIAGVDRDIVGVEEIFRLQRMDAVTDVERRFLR